MDREQFKIWLESQKADEIVGIRGSSLTCPIARCFDCEVVPGLYPERYPKWVALFVIKIDDGIPDSVSTAEALATLSEVPVTL